jgi:F0F1-type ATP synthase membrane subunit b/b'
LKLSKPFLIPLEAASAIRFGLAQYFSTDFFYPLPMLLPTIDQRKREVARELKVMKRLKATKQI